MTPERPVLGVGAIVFDSDGRVLLVRRGRPPREGTWSLPGGRVELGERLEEALLREVAEETGIVVEVVSLVDLYQFLERDDTGGVIHHFVVADYHCRLRGGTLRAGSDVSDASFVPLDELEDYRLNPEALKMIARVSPAV